MPIDRRTFLIGGLAGIGVVAAGLYIKSGHIERPKKRLRIGYVPLADFSPLKFAQDSPAFQNQGVEVELIKLQSGARILEGIASKTIDIGVTNLVTLLLARAKGIDYQIVSGATIERREAPLHAIVVNKDSDIRNVSDLRGRRVAVNALKSVNELVLTAIADKAGFSVKEFNFIETPFPQMVGVLKNNAVEAVVVVEPYVTQAVRQFECRVVAHHIVEEFGDTPVAAYVADSREAAGLAPEIRSFRKGLEEASAALNSPSTDARKFIAEFTGLSPELVAQMNLPKFVTQLEPTAADKMIEMMLKYQWISEGSRQSVMRGLFVAG
ncbi:MAG TPA: ABC transporter substrate-binding protein [Nitrospira sp.]|nr:ABC transporter substrate-binding protein [Nitrospira sp.]